jgi:hypothetical protein
MAVGRSSDREEYARVVQHFTRRRRVERCSSGNATTWFKHTKQGREGTVYVDQERTRILKKVIVSLEEDPIARFEALEKVNAAASAHGICPKAHRIYYELSDRGVLFFCIESDYFNGPAYSELSAPANRKVAPLIQAHAKKMVRCGIWHGDLHGGNVLVSPDLTAVTFIDFGNGCMDMRHRATVEALALRKLEMRA